MEADNQNEAEMDNMQPIDDYEIDRTLVNKQINYWYEFLTILSVFILLIKLVLSNSISLAVPFIMLAFYKLVKILQEIYSLINPLRTNPRPLVVKEIIINTCTLLFYFYLVIRNYVKSPNLIYSVIPLTIGNILFKIIKVQHHDKIKEYTFNIEYCLKIILSITLLLVGLKEAKAISWSWYSIFSPVWTMSIILFIISIFQLINMCRILKRYCKNGTHISNAAYSAWLSYLTGGTAGTIVFLVYSLASELNKGTWDHTIAALLVLVLYLTTLIVFTFLCSNIIS